MIIDKEKRCDCGAIHDGTWKDINDNQECWNKLSYEEFEKIVRSLWGMKK